MGYPLTLTSQAQGDVLRERERQIYEEGWTDDHDDGHDEGELAAAAVCYARQHGPHGPLYVAFEDGRVPDDWPWDAAWWKPKDQRGDLVRAAALIIAEIERIDRAACRNPTP